jgi:tetratricopeptide (TPR) repeat protein/SAM-dependent methyltransferase
MNRKDRRAGQSRGQIPALPPGGRRPVDQLFNLALEHVSAGRLAEAEFAFHRVLELDPKHADSLNGLGMLAHQCGHSDAAIELIGEAITLNDRVAQYHYNIGLVFAALGRVDEAVTHNRRAVALKPDYADAHTNLAGMLSAQGHFSDAVLHFRRALARRADLPLAYTNLATALLSEEKPEEALSVIVRGLAVKATDELKRMFLLCFQALQSAPKIARLRALVERAMTERWDRPETFAAAVTALVKQNATVAACIERAECWPRRPPPPDLFGPQRVAAIANDRLLQLFLVSTPIRDVALERLLTNARLAILDLASATPAADVSDLVLDLSGALAQQCFLNEYVFDWTREEQDRACALRDRLAAALRSDDVVPALMVAAVAAYFPLHSLDTPPKRFERSWPDAVTRLVVQQLHEPAEEQSLRSHIPIMSPIADDVSLLVRQQYEENPYPRWTATSSWQPRLTFDDKIGIQFPHATVAKLGKTNVEILIAGCGTGRHAIEIAQLYVDIRILAIDLSLASLAYATRKARELCIANVEFGQADILQLAGLRRSFDVIEAVGVLHHLRDPLEGWRILLGMLRPGGFMKIGLYSALARQHVTATRAFIAERGYGHTADDIRRCRQDLLALDDGPIDKKTLEASEFFTISECRDLLFHVEEHVTSIPAIKSFLAVNDLAFIGIETQARNRYAELYRDDKAMNDLDRWHTVELAHPTTFGGMYQFWVQKPA